METRHNYSVDALFIGLFHFIPIQGIDVKFRAPCKERWGKPMNSSFLGLRLVLTLSGSAFPVVRQARRGGGGAQRPGCQKSRLTSTDKNETLHESLYS